MRPITLELSGFGTFRERVEVSFEDADYFAFVGPTGSGKSTIIDALCFALYGSVPRYENENLVAPVISQGALEARVRLDFAIDDVTYTAARVVRRSGKGATTKEARLERAGEVLAGNADELTDAVKELLGLSFRQFTKCVVLPQGEFARFLHDKPADRQDLLVRLLNLNVYERMRYAANQRAADAKNQIAVLHQRLEQDLAFATKEALADAKTRAARIEALRTRVGEATPALEALEAQLEGATTKVTETKSWLETIARLKVPAEVAELSEALKQAKISVKDAEKQVGAARKAAEVATKARAALGERDPLLKSLDAHERKAALHLTLTEARAGLATATEVRDGAQQALQGAEKEHAAALKNHRAMESEHAAHLLTGTLKKGELCPVCAQKVAMVPRRKAPAALTTTEKALARSEKGLATARSSAEKASLELTRWSRDVELNEKEMATLEALVAKHADRAAIESKLAAMDGAEAAVEQARDGERAAYDSLNEIHKIADEVVERESEARRDFSDARDALVAMGAPAATGKDLATDWSALLSWAGKQRPQLDKARSEAAKIAETADKARAALTEELAAACRDCEIELDGRELVDVVAGAHARAAAEVERITKAMKDVERLSAELIRHQRVHDLAGALANHLSARGFEKWLVNEAIRRLVVGANEILVELSGEQYALTIDDTGNFLVIDHHNADEQRSARTLSGGETFLASLSLALALADQLAELATKGAARLDAIFLDEGFGTLDPETLDVVAATVENLSHRGRMVGVVTHVRELAERVPVQFRVKKDPRGSTVERAGV